MFSSYEQISHYQGVHAQLAALQAQHLRAAEALALVCRRMHALLRARPLPLQLSFRVPLRAAALHALLSPELAGRVEALHLWDWDWFLSPPKPALPHETLLAVLRNQAGSLRHLALEGQPAAVLGEPGVDLRFLCQLTRLEVFAPKALRLVPAALPQGLVGMVCTMEDMKPGDGRITWDMSEASAPPGCLPRLDWMHLRVSGAVRLDVAHAWPGVHVRLSACHGPQRGDFAVARAHVASGLWNGAECGIFHTARSVAVSGCDMSFNGHPRLLPQLLCPTTGLLTAVVLDARACFRARDDDDDDAEGDGDDNGDDDYDDDDADDTVQRNITALARNLHMLIEARKDTFAFELTGIATERPVLAWRRWPCGGTSEHDAARAAHARTRAWAWRALGLDVAPALPGILF